MNSKQKKTVVLYFMLPILALMPGLASASQFENPLSNTMTVETLIQNVIKFFIGLVGFLALLGIVYGGVLIVIGGMRNEQDLKRGKEIIFWAIIGLMAVGMSATILYVITLALGLTPVP